MSIFYNKEDKHRTFQDPPKFPEDRYITPEALAVQNNLKYNDQVPFNPSMLSADYGRGKHNYDNEVVTHDNRNWVEKKADQNAAWGKGPSPIITAVSMHSPILGGVMDVLNSAGAHGTKLFGDFSRVVTGNGVTTAPRGALNKTVKQNTSKNRTSAAKNIATEVALAVTGEAVGKAAVSGYRSIAKNIKLPGTLANNNIQQSSKAIAKTKAASDRAAMLKTKAANDRVAMLKTKEEMQRKVNMLALPEAPRYASKTYNTSMQSNLDILAASAPRTTAAERFSLVEMLGDGNLTTKTPPSTVYRGVKLPTVENAPNSAFVSGTSMVTEPNYLDISPEGGKRMIDFATQSNMPWKQGTSASNIGSGNFLMDVPFTTPSQRGAKMYSHSPWQINKDRLFGGTSIKAKNSRRYKSDTGDHPTGLNQEFALTEPGRTHVGADIEHFDRNLMSKFLGKDTKDISLKEADAFWRKFGVDYLKNEVSWYGGLIDEMQSAAHMYRPSNSVSTFRAGGILYKS